MSFGSTPAIKLKSRSRCRSGMLAKMACAAIRQSFAERGVTPAHRHRAYKCAALRAASRASGAITIGNSPSTRSQRLNRSGLSAPWRTSCRMGGENLKAGDRVVVFLDHARIALLQVEAAAEAARGRG